MFRVTLLFVVPEFGAKEKSTVPGPVPEAPEVKVSQGGVPEMLYEQALAMVTPTEPAPPDEVKLAPCALRPVEQFTPL
jgi:hypothetical protein